MNQGLFEGTRELQISGQAELRSNACLQSVLLPPERASVSIHHFPGSAG